MRSARSVVLPALAAGAAVVVAMAVSREDAPARVANTATTVAATAGSPSTSVPTSTTAVAAATAAATGTAGQLAEGEAGVDGPRPGVVVTNSGSATASVGGNVVSGGPGPGDPPAAIVTGDATAVGNSSSVRTP